MLNKICPICNSKALSTDSFCMKCGCDLRNVQVDIERPKYSYDKECPECKTGNLKFATICRNCGYSFSAIKEQSEKNNIEDNIGHSEEEQIIDSENEIINDSNNAETWDLILYGSQIIIAFLMILFIDDKSMNDNSRINKTSDLNLSPPNQNQSKEVQTDTANSISQYKLPPDTTYLSPSNQTQDIEGPNIDNTNDEENKTSETSTDIEKSYVDAATDSVMSYVNVDVRPSYKGGEAEWNKYLQKELNNNIPNANNAPPGDYVANIWVIVELNGSLSHYGYEELGYGMPNEALRVVGKSPLLWNPAINNGRPVRCWLKIPIPFVVKKFPLPKL